MKNTLIIFMILLLSGCATIRPWDKTEKIMLGVALSAQAVDTAQTYNFLSNPCGLREGNPLIKDTNDLIQLKVVGNALILGTCHLLPHKARKWALGIWSTIGVGTVLWNYNKGATIK